MQRPCRDERGSMRKSNALLYDIETAPMNTELWRPNQQWIPHEMLNEDSFMLTWSAKPLERGRVFHDAVTPDEALARDDTRIVASLAEHMREAEVVIAHNAKRFDQPRVNGRLMVLELEPLTPVRVVDTLSLARKSFDLAYNSLDYLADILFHDHKIKTEFDLWRRVVRGDQQAIDKMVRYNRKDVRLLEKVFLRMRPYVRGLPRMAVPSYDREHACPFCAGADLMKRGFHETNVSRFQTWQCNTCGRYSRTYVGTAQPRAGLIPLP
jgi:hypothetical protein